MSNYYIVSTEIDLLTRKQKPNIAIDINYEAKSYDTNNNTCKIKVSDEAIINGTLITEQQYLEN